MIDLFAPRGRGGYRPSLAERVDADGDCWIWTGSGQGNGYAQVSIKGRPVGVHRVFYEALVGPIPDGYDIDHLCRVRLCVNPDHLEAVTRLENIRRGRTGANMRNKTHCPQGHPYSIENTYRRQNGNRHCKTCVLSQQRARYTARLEALEG